jgi:hypothetical protein
MFEQEHSTRHRRKGFGFVQGRHYYEGIGTPFSHLSLQRAARKIHVVVIPLVIVRHLD